MEANINPMADRNEGFVEKCLNRIKACRTRKTRGKSPRLQADAEGRG